MAQTFEEITKGVVNRFLQNILFIDDKAFQSDNKENEFDAGQISSAFAKNGKLCTIFAPSSECDLCQCSSLFSKADAIVLDWYLDLTSSKESVDDEKDAEEDEPRGFYTKYLIEEIVADAKNEKLKIIVVYTGETDLRGITQEIHSCIAQYGNFKQGDCCVYSSNVVIVVRAKYNGEEQFKHLEDLKDKVIKYENLPDFITDEFSIHVNGLLSVFALLSISIIRENTSRILNVYSPELDIAYLGHKMVLPNSEDAKELLIKLFGESITDLISSSCIDTQDWQSLWIKDRYTHPQTIKVADNKSIQVDQECITKLFSTHFNDFEKSIKTIFGNLSNNDAKLIRKNAALLLDESADNVKAANLLFARLTHHKNVFLPQRENPYLTLGTILYSSTTDKYYLCIQQRCDSLRIDGIRRFLFLPLVESGGETHVVVTNEKQLQIAKYSYDIKTIKFEADKDKRYVCSKRIKNNMGKDTFVFTSIHKEEFEWVLELKDLHAQRILNSYSANLSRVGLDESEWLRQL